MAKRVEEYLLFRRSFGYALRIEGGVLQEFARFADEKNHKGSLTTEFILEWVRRPSNAKRIYLAKRLETIIGFARYCRIFDPATEIPPKGLYGPAHRRMAPYLYNPQQLRQLADPDSGSASRDPFLRLTHATVFGLLACTGLRISEALRLLRNDVDLAEALLTIRQSKCRPMRLVPLHGSATIRLRAYSQQRDRRFSQANHFFVNRSGEAISYQSIRAAFRQMTIRLGWVTEGQRPRLHDLRHTFASRVLAKWQDRPDGGEDRIDWLSRYLGHERVSATYWYLSAVPGLLANAADRFEPRAKDLSK